MCKKLICPTVVALALSLVLSSVAYALHPAPVAWWKFDGDALDSSGNDHHGTLMGNPAPVFAAGVFDQALDTTESGGPGYVEITGYKGILGPNPFSITAWINTSDSSGTLMGWGSTAGGTTRVEFRINADRLRCESSGNVQGDTTLPDNEWIHVAVTVKADAIITEPDVTLYLNGQVDNRISTGGTAALLMEAGYDVTIARRHTSGRWFDALIDDLRLYDVELTQAQVQEAMAGVGPTPPGVAREPSPEKEATDVPRDVVLNWLPGAYAPAVNGHIIYLSESFNDVNDGIGGVTLSDTSYTPPQRLPFATTYYWRVDEVNAPPDSAVHRGEVWSFTTEPVGYSIGANSITATASSSGQATTGPENTINGSGLDPNDLHSTEPTDMWASDNEPLGAWIQYEFDRVYKLHQMWVWNSNQVLEPLFGFGLKDVTVEYSANGVDWTALADVPQFTRAPGTAGYAHDTTVDFGGAMAKLVKLTATSNWGGALPQYGLSEARFFSIPVSAREPSPDNWATDVNPAVTLTWRAGRDAATHDMYLGNDLNAVVDANTPVATLTDATHSADLDLAETYFWRIDEVNDAETPTTWQGNLWTFSTQDYLAVDDFESYNDIDPPDPESHRIFEAWKDGFGIATNGALVGYDPPQPSYAETTIVHGGDQSVPVFYSNTAGAVSSEIARTFAPAQDWTKHGIRTLGLWFHGTAGNTGQLYVKINGVEVPYDSDAGNLARTLWQPWNIDLPALGLNLTSVTMLAIGIDGNGGAGTFYIDDIRLYPFERELITPAEPNNANLAAHWELDGNFNDSSGNGLHATAMGGPVFAAGKIGQAVSLDGVDDYAQVTGYKGILGPSAFTIAAWIKTIDNGVIVGWGSDRGTGDDGARLEFRTDGDRLRIEHGGGNFQGDATVTDDNWHHVAVTKRENGVLQSPDTVLYIDGAPDATRGGDGDPSDIQALHDLTIGREHDREDRWLAGLLDDLRIYDYELSADEIAGLAGRTTPFDGPLSAPPPVELEEVQLEAEAADPLGASWRSYDDPNASGGKAIGSDDGDGNDNDVAPGADWTATYSFTVPTGQYKIVLRAQENGSDSFWVRIPSAVSQTHEDPDQPGTGWVRFNGIDAPSGWAWDEVHSNDHSNAVVTWLLLAGDHTLEIAKREDGVLLDAIAIFRIE